MFEGECRVVAQVQEVFRLICRWEIRGCESPALCRDGLVVLSYLPFCSCTEISYPCFFLNALFCQK